MKKTSKILSLFLALLTLLTVTVVPVNAEAGPYTYLTIETDTTSVEIGDTVTVDVSVAENSNLGTLTVDLVFDSSVFEPVSISNHGMFDFNDRGGEKVNLYYADRKARFVAANADSITAEGILFTVVLKAINSAVESEISLNVSEATDYNYDNVYTFTNTVYVDVNGETSVTAPSLTMVADKTDVEVGDTVQIDVYLSENSYLSALTVDLIYDSDCFTPVNMYSSGLFPTYSDFDGTNMNYADGAARFIGATASYITYGDVVFTVVFEVTDDAHNSVMWLDVKEAVDDDFNTLDFETNIIYFNEGEYDYVPTIVIEEPSRTTIRHKDGIILHASFWDEPEGSYVEWYADNENFKLDVVDEGNALEIISDKNGYTTFTAVLYDVDGNVLDYDEVEMRSKAGFFDKIGSFFRSIFGGSTIYEY